MEILTHQQIDQRTCGRPVLVEPGFSRVELRSIPEMAVDPSGLVHGGFIFGLADHAAMIAVNHPHVVLGAAQVTFLKPVRVGEDLSAEARVQESSGRKHRVTVEVRQSGTPVFSGTLTCFVLDRHVLS